MTESTRLLVTILTLLVMVIGLLGTVLPVLPGPVLIFAAALLYGVLDGFQALGWPSLLAIGLLALLATGIDFLTSSLGAKAGGASGWSIVAGLIGGLLGTLVFALPGGIVGALASVLLVEYARLREWKPAAKSSAGWLAGWLLSSVVRFAIALVMIGVFVWQVF
ncbi:MAG TPA: DUF456 domain-containing protein [Anaerolineae bacterium]|nr:DUF456 domain-containing protein [Anaerolineae bacterium]